jgi:hypothetical protein
MLEGELLEQDAACKESESLPFCKKDRTLSSCGNACGTNGSSEDVERVPSLHFHDATHADMDPNEVLNMD